MQLPLKKYVGNDSYFTKKKKICFLSLFKSLPRGTLNTRLCDLTMISRPFPFRQTTNIDGPNASNRAGIYTILLISIVRVIFSCETEIHKIY